MNPKTIVALLGVAVTLVKIYSDHEDAKVAQENNHQ